MSWCNDAWWVTEKIQNIFTENAAKILKISIQNIYLYINYLLFNSFLVSISLLLIAVGNGSIRACITSLGALQFKVPEQSRQLVEYFSLYYFVYYFGIFLSKLLPPLVRAKTQCFNKNGCYPAVFGTLAFSFLLAWSKFPNYWKKLIFAIELLI